MDVIKCISERRSIRKYTDQEISDQVMKQLLDLGVKAATGSNEQPWGFVIIRGKEEIDELNDRFKQELAAHIEDFPPVKRYEKWFTNPRYHMFNRANTLLLIYGNPQSFWHQHDCSLVAANIMLAAHDMGIGTCWIGVCHQLANTEEFKAKYNVPAEWQLAVTLSMGYAAETLSPPQRREPIIFNAVPK